MVMLLVFMSKDVTFCKNSKKTGEVGNAEMYPSFKISSNAIAIDKMEEI